MLLKLTQLMEELNMILYSQKFIKNSFFFFNFKLGFRAGRIHRFLISRSVFKIIYSESNKTEVKGIIRFYIIHLLFLKL